MLFFIRARASDTITLNSRVAVMFTMITNNCLFKFHIHAVIDAVCVCRLISSADAKSIANTVWMTSPRSDHRNIFVWKRETHAKHHTNEWRLKSDWTIPIVHLHWLGWLVCDSGKANTSYMWRAASRRELCIRTARERERENSRYTHTAHTQWYIGERRTECCVSEQL